MNWITIIASAIVSILTVLGGGSILYYKATNKAKEAEADGKRVEVELQEAEAWRALYEEQKQRNEEKSERLRQAYAKIDDYKEREAHLLRIIQQLKWYRCTKNEAECTVRRPPRDYDKDVEQLEIELLELAKSNTKQ